MYSPLCVPRPGQSQLAAVHSFFLLALVNQLLYSSGSRARFKNHSGWRNPFYGVLDLILLGVANYQDELKACASRSAESREAEGGEYRLKPAPSGKSCAAFGE